MARPEKNSVDFPKWNPQKNTRFVIYQGLNERERWLYFSNSFRGFARNKKVRKIIFEQYENRCSNCKTEENLQIDHVVSVVRCWNEKKYEFCNTQENFQILCATCNQQKPL